MSRYNIRFKQEDVGYVKPWRITDFIEKITTLHYKEELIKDIRLRLSNGVNPKNIILFDKSFNIHRSYSNLSQSFLLSQRGAKLTYHLGNFSSLYPNKEINSISLLFELFSFSYTLLNRFRVKIYKDRLHVYITEVLSSNEKELNLSTFRDDISSLIAQISDDDGPAEVIYKIEAKIKEVNDKHFTFCNDETEFQRLEESLSDQPLIEKFKAKKFKNLYDKLVLRFYNKFNDIQRPIVGIYNDESKSIEIFATSYIKRQGVDDSQIDLKSVTHNSPYEIFITAGATVVMMLYQMYCNKIDENPPTPLMENVDDIDEAETNEEYLMFDEPNEVFDEEKWLENLEKLQEFIAHEDIQVHELEEGNGLDEGVKFVLAGIERKVDHSLKKNFEDNNFISGNIDVEKTGEAV